jgi:hypothetical protein
MNEDVLVKMIRSSGFQPPHTALVRQAEVENYKMFGWTRDNHQDFQFEPKPKKGKKC